MPRQSVEPKEDGEPWPPPERFISPCVVLTLHALLVYDVVCHRGVQKHQRIRRYGHPKPSDTTPLPEIESHDLLHFLQWGLVALAIAAYLRTVLADPGFLRHPRAASEKPAKPWLLTALSCCPAAVALAIASPVLALQAALRGRSAGGGPGARDVRDAPARELQPIGRSAHDREEAVDELEKDPGVDADLESGIQLANVADRVDADLEHGAGETGEEEERSSGSQAGGGGRKRRDRDAKRRERGGDAESEGGQKHVYQSGHRLRFCKICEMHQPLRTKHCRDCGRCVRTHDHHCPWVGTCVAEGNRVFFFWFLVAQFTELLVFDIEGVSILLRFGFDPPAWLNYAPLLCLGLAVITLLTLMVSCLFCFHSYLASANITTWENISWHNISYLRSINEEDGSPFSMSLRQNLSMYCFRLRTTFVKRDEEGWASWEIGEPRQPIDMEVDCPSLCGVDGPCHCCVECCRECCKT